MAQGRRRIQLVSRPGLLGWFQRLWSRSGEISTEGDPVDGIDYTLRHKAAVRAMRGFIESIETYQLHTRKTVHVVSRYRMPADPGLEERVPDWLADRVRFGVVRGEGGAFTYLPIRAVDVQWSEHGMELFLHLDAPVVPGTRAFIAAYLGEGDRNDELREMPTTLMLGDPG